MVPRREGGGGLGASHRRGSTALAASAACAGNGILIGTGSEVSLCVAAFEELTADGVRARVVSMPSWELFERQPETHQLR